ncbi:hypothetical protein [Streptomyces sp. NPDC047928]|uniref:hypothetical protein n=1 Tax=unclassified Streptomyces TaxID=2593676 RepID=UPI0037160C34
MSEDEFRGPPWQLDHTTASRTYRDSLPPEVRELFQDAAFELITAKNPYHLDGVEPKRSTRPRGEHTIWVDGGRGWMDFTFTDRVAEPQIQVTGIFWQ